MGKLIDLTGQRFGRLTVIERVENDKQRRVRWLCQCECGNAVAILAKSLRSGNTKSCGCISKENPPRSTHGQAHTRLFRIWCSMKTRCKNPSQDSYSRYGGRGITVCDEWQRFEPFAEWANANGYCDGLSIDRIDVNGNYEPGNVRFVSMKIQQNNRSNNHYITFQRKTQTIAQWAEELNMNARLINCRLFRGWSAEEALTIPPGGKRKK